MIFDEFPTLKSSFIIMRKPDSKDIPRLRTLKKSKLVYHLEPTYLPELLVPSCEEFINKEIDRLFDSRTNILFGIYYASIPDKFIGFGELYDYSEENKSICIGVRIMKHAWNHGIATNAIRLMKNYVFNECGLKEIIAHVRVENIGSAMSLFNNGFRKHGKEHNEDWGYEKPAKANEFVLYSEKR